MTERIYLAADLGAESGRVMAGAWDGRRIKLEELHRFPNGPVEVAGSLRWDVEKLWTEIHHGLGVAAKRFGAAAASVGVDTWGVDYALLSREGELLGQPFNYRDARTRGLLAAALAKVPRAEIFSATGSQFLEINTLYQLLAANERDPALLASADKFLMIPDWLHFKMCGARTGSGQVATAPVKAKKKGWSHRARGAVVGAGAGAVTGAIINKNNRGAGAVIGAVVGAAGGYIIGNEVDKKNGR